MGNEILFQWEFHIYFGEEHKTFKEKMFHNPSQSQPKATQPKEPFFTEHQSPTPELSQPESSKKHKKVMKAKKPKKYEPSPETSNSTSSSVSLTFRDCDNYEPTTEKGLSEKSTREAVKEDLVVNAKVLEATDANIKNSVDKGKGIARYTDDLPSKLVKASWKVRTNPDAPGIIDYEIDGKMVQITHDELQAHLDKRIKWKRML
uniref:Uncharacterized protein n=1 Tax=Tanacetum cinerariifolium TaxID=118510 RepID=A0A6L2NNZ6_TANCI|nr:hypothetical protein [Tanacetum cinerariifolium]